MKIETAPTAWLRAIVHEVCATLEINPAMLPTDAHLAAEDVSEKIRDAIEDATEGYDDFDLAGSVSGNPKPRTSASAGLRELATQLHKLLGQIHYLSATADDTADAVSDEIAAIEEAIKAKENPK